MAAGRSLPPDEVLRPPGEMPPDVPHSVWPDHEVVQVLVVEKRPQRRKHHRNHAHPPEWHLRLQQHRGNLNVGIFQRGPAAFQILAEASPHMIGNPLSLGRRKFGNDIHLQFRIDPFHSIEKCRDQLVRAGGERDLDPGSQMIDRGSSRTVCPRSCHISSACRQNAVETGLTNGSIVWPLRPK